MSAEHEGEETLHMLPRETSTGGALSSHSTDNGKRKDTKYEVVPEVIPKIRPVPQGVPSTTTTFQYTPEDPEVVVWTCHPSHKGIHVPFHANITCATGSSKPTLTLTEIQIFDPVAPVGVHSQVAEVSDWSNEPFAESYKLMSECDTSALRTLLPPSKTIDITHVRGIVFVGLDIDKHCVVTRDLPIRTAKTRVEGEGGGEEGEIAENEGDPSNILHMCGAFLIARPPPHLAPSASLAYAGIMYPGMPPQTPGTKPNKQVASFLALMSSLAKIVYASSGKVEAIGAIKSHKGSLFNETPPRGTDLGTKSCLPMCYLDTPTWFLPTPWYLVGSLTWLRCMHPRTTAIFKQSIHDAVFFETTKPLSSTSRRYQDAKLFSPVHVLLLCTDSLYPSTEFAVRPSERIITDKTDLLSKMVTRSKTALVQAGADNPVYGLHRSFLIWGLDGEDANRLKVLLGSLYSFINIKSMQMDPCTLMAIQVQHANEQSYTSRGGELVQLTLESVCQTRDFNTRLRWSVALTDEMFNKCCIFGKRPTFKSLDYEPNLNQTVMTMMGSGVPFLSQDTEHATVSMRLLAATVVACRLCIIASNSENNSSLWANAIHSVSMWFSETCNKELSETFISESESPPDILVGIITATMKALDDTVKSKTSVVDSPPLRGSGSRSRSRSRSGSGISERMVPPRRTIPSTRERAGSVSISRSGSGSGSRSGSRSRKDPSASTGTSTGRSSSTGLISDSSLSGPSRARSLSSKSASVVAGGGEDEGEGEGEEERKGEGSDTYTSEIAGAGAGAGSGEVENTPKIAKPCKKGAVAVLGKFKNVYTCLRAFVDEDTEPIDMADVEAPTLRACLDFITELDGSSPYIGSENKFLLDDDERGCVETIKSILLSDTMGESLNLNAVSIPVCLIMEISSCLLNICMLIQRCTVESESAIKRKMGNRCPPKHPVQSMPDACNTPDVMQALTEFATSDLEVTLDAVVNYMSRAGAFSFWYHADDMVVFDTGVAAVTLIGKMVMGQFLGKSVNALQATIAPWVTLSNPLDPTTRFLQPKSLSESKKERTSILQEDARHRTTLMKLSQTSGFLMQSIELLNDINPSEKPLVGTTKTIGRSKIMEIKLGKKSASSVAQTSKRPTREPAPLVPAFGPDHITEGRQLRNRATIPRTKRYQETESSEEEEEEEEDSEYDGSDIGSDDREEEEDGGEEEFDSE